MKTQKRISGITLYYPAEYQLKETPPEAEAKTTRRAAKNRGTADTEQADRESKELHLLLLEALAAQEFTTIDTIDLGLSADAVPTEGRRADTLAPAEAEAEVLKLAVPLEASEKGVLLLVEDDYFSWSFPSDSAEQVRGPGKGAEGAPKGAYFEVPLGEGPPTRDATRSMGGWIRRRLAQRITAYVLKFAARSSANHAIKLLERNVQRGLILLSQKLSPNELDPLQWRLIPDPSTLQLPDDRAPRILLLIHGTFSTTLGSYGALRLFEWGQAFLTDAAQRYDLILGFDHPTLSEDPLENALELERLLTALPAKHPPIFDAVGFSRGGLVLRSLIEIVGPNAASPLTFRKGIFVGATNAGTQLAAPDNWQSLIDFYTNLTVGALRFFKLLIPGTMAWSTVVTGLLKGVGSFAKYLAIESINKGGVPGLAAMEPEGDFIKALNRSLLNSPAFEEIAYYAVTSDFMPSLEEENALQKQLPKRLLQVADRVIDRLMGAANDLVVDTLSMTTFSPATTSFVQEVCDFGRNSYVYHTVYFAHPPVCEALRKWLEISEPRGERGRRTRSAVPFIGGALKPDYRKPTVASALPPVKAERPTIEVQVLWGNIQEVDGDVFAVGHYQGVLPQRAEKALDEKISGTDDQQRLVLTQLTRRGLLNGQIGNIAFFPWAGKTERLVAVCGMGHPGAFGEAELWQLQRNLIWSLNVLPDDRTLCTVLIGSGEGTLTTELALRGLLSGLADTLSASGGRHRIRRLRIVEKFRHKAEKIQENLADIAKVGNKALKLQLAPEVIAAQGGEFSDAHHLVLMITAAVRACQEAGKPEAQALDQLLGLLPREHELAAGVKEALGRLAKSEGGNLSGFACRISLRIEAQGANSNEHFPTRISFIQDGALIRAAAIRDTATVPERVIDVDPALIAEAVRRLNDPAPEEVSAHSDMLLRLIVPQDFRDLLPGGSPLIFELDRHTAAVQWEMLATSIDEDGAPFLGLNRPLARQLRTAYSAPPSLGQPRRERLKALVIGDPGDPAKGGALKCAEEEAVSVSQLLKKHGLEVELLLGAPREGKAQIGQGSKPAGRYDVLDRLIRGNFDIVHYAGHGDYDMADPSRTGWLFSDGLLKAGEIKRMDKAPTLIFANACLSGRLSEGAGDLRRHPYGEAGLLPSLADEFFRRGVRNYIGTAWKIDDEGALAFAKQFYTAFISGSGTLTLGQALLKARQGLAESKQDYRCLWGAYQHYGDPGLRFDEM